MSATNAAHAHGCLFTDISLKCESRMVYLAAMNIDSAFPSQRRFTSTSRTQ